MNYPEDTTDYQFAEIDSNFVDSLIRAGDYSYINQNVQGKGLWESFKDFIFGWLREQGIFLGNWMENLLLVLCLIVFVAGTLYLLSRYNRRVRKKLKQSIPPDLKESAQEWNEEWVQKQRESAKAARNRKEAVRWTYHLALIWLNGVDIIQRSDYKTAYDYQKEITTPELNRHFEQLRALHEKAWYDEVEILDSDVQECDHLLQEIKAVLDETD